MSRNSKARNDFAKILSQYEQKVERRLDTRLAQEVYETAQEVIRKAPSQTGNLRRSVTTDKQDPLKYQISVNAEYAPYVEFGTLHQTAQPFFYSTVEGQIDNMVQGLVEEIKKL